MSDDKPLDPTRDNSTKKAPLGDPSAPPNPSTRDAAAQAGSKGGEPGKGTAGATGSAGASSTGTSTGATGAGSTSAGATSTGTRSGATGGGQSSSDQKQSDQKQKAREEVHETGDKLKSEARDTVREFADSARASAEAQAERQQRAAAGELGGIARALRKTADEVEGQSYFPLDRYARRAADKLDDLSENLQGSDIRTVIHRLETYTREQPGVVLGGAIISGFLLARFMRASAEREYEGGSDNRYNSAGSRASTSGTQRQTTGTGLYPGSDSAYQ